MTNSESTVYQFLNTMAPVTTGQQRRRIVESSCASEHFLFTKSRVAIISCGELPPSMFVASQKHREH